MPLFMDVHEKVDGANAEAVAAAHKKDLEVQSKYQRYWLDESVGRIYCLVEAPDKESAIRVHREAHGLVPDDIHEVVEGE